jgi:hypothetical protein
MMNVKRRVAAVSAGLIIAGAGAMAAAPIASAFAVTPAPGGGYVHLNSDEAQVLHDAHLGGTIDAVTGWQPDPDSGLTFGAAIDQFSGRAAASPSGTFYAGLTEIPNNLTWHTGWRR